MPRVTWDKSSGTGITEKRDEVTESLKTVAKKPKSKIATFISPYRFYKIRQMPMKMRYVEGVGKEAIPGTEKYIEFDNWKFQTSDSKDIKFLLERQEFGVNYSIDPADPTHYWEDHDWFKRKMVEQRVMVVPGPIDLAKEAEGNVAGILKSAGQSMAAQIKKKQTQITNLKMSPGGPSGEQV